MAVSLQVFTHLPTNFMLMALPLCPNGYAAVGLWCSRALLCQMDVPTREYCLMAIVLERERVAASSVIGAARAVAAVGGPLATCALWSRVGPGAPLVVAGAIKALYDIALLAAFGSIAPPEEEEDRRRSSPPPTANRRASDAAAARDAALAAAFHAAEVIEASQAWREDEEEDSSWALGPWIIS